MFVVRRNKIKEMKNVNLICRLKYFKLVHDEFVVKKKPYA